MCTFVLDVWLCLPYYFGKKTVCFLLLSKFSVPYGSLELLNVRRREHVQLFQHPPRVISTFSWSWKAWLKWRRLLSPFQGRGNWGCWECCSTPNSYPQSIDAYLTVLPYFLPISIKAPKFLTPSVGSAFAAEPSCWESSMHVQNDEGILYVTRRCQASFFSFQKEEKTKKIMERTEYCS